MLYHTALVSVREIIYPANGSKEKERKEINELWIKIYKWVVETGRKEELEIFEFIWDLAGIQVPSSLPWMSA